MSKSSLQHAGMVAVVGRANVGKSSLINAIVGEKISIVSPVAQTTRHLIRAMLTDERGQLVLLDTPGVHKAQGDLGKIMNKLARKASEGVDAVLLVLDPGDPLRDEDAGWISRLAQVDLPVVIALNKSDAPATHEAELRACWDTHASTVKKTATWLPVSARTGAGVPELVSDLFSILPEGPPLFPEDIISDYPRKLAIADFIREKLFAVLLDELPHDVAVWVEKLEEEGENWTVTATIYVNRPTQKGIVIGHKGRLLRKMQRQSEGELSNIYEKKVKVNLWVKIEPHWDRNFFLLKQLGHLE